VPTPQTSAAGKSLQDYHQMYFTWSLGGPQTDHHGNVQFLPVPAGAYQNESGYWVGSADVALKSKWSFFLPVYVFYGERYNTGALDDPPGWPPAEAFTDADVLITLDGTPILDSGTVDLSTYYGDTVYFTQPIPYAEPTAYGSVAALWIKGLRFVEPALSDGEHMLHLLVTSQFLQDNFLFPGWDNTWHISVGH